MPLLLDAVGAAEDNFWGRARTRGWKTGFITRQEGGNPLYTVCPFYKSTKKNLNRDLESWFPIQNKIVPSLTRVRSRGRPTGFLWRHPWPLGCESNGVVKKSLHKKTSHVILIMYSHAVEFVSVWRCSMQRVANCPMNINFHPLHYTRKNYSLIIISCTFPGASSVPRTLAFAFSVHHFILIVVLESSDRNWITSIATAVYSVLLSHYMRISITRFWEESVNLPSTFLRTCRILKALSLALLVLTVSQWSVTWWRWWHKVTTSVHTTTLHFSVSAT